MAPPAPNADGKRIRVLVVDDSVVIRRIVSELIDSDPDLQVVGTAQNGRIALSKIEQLQPHVITLDIEMPEMDGLATLRELRNRRIRTPVIMFSTLTARAAASTLDALSLGAADYVTKPSNVGSTDLAMERVREDLIPKIKTFARRSPGVMSAPALSRAVARPSAPPPTVRPRPAGIGSRRIELVAIGTSTGGPNALEDVFRRLPPSIDVPVVVVQHMPPVFTKILADRLSAKTAWQVHEATSGMRLEPRNAYIAPGDHHMVVERAPLGGGRLTLNQSAPENSCRPSVDVLFRSVAAAYGPAALGVVMTGMGQDGFEGCKLLVERGAEVLAQDEATSVVWGMPGYVSRAGLASEILALDQIPAAIERRVMRTSTVRPSTARSQTETRAPR